MRSTYDVDPKLLAEAQALLGEKSPSKAVNEALRQLVRRHKLDQLRKLLGTIDLDFDWQEAKERELEDMRRNEL